MGEGVALGTIPRGGPIELFLISASWRNKGYGLFYLVLGWCIYQIGVVLIGKHSP